MPSGGQVAGCSINDYSAVLVNGNAVSRNQAKDTGGGVAVSHSSVANLMANNVTSNTARSGGGIGVLDGAAGLIANNEMVGNQAGHGGGIGTYQNGELTISGNGIYLNTALFGGGGIHINAEGNDAPLSIVANIVYSNTAEYGAGVDVRNANAEVLIAGNDIRFNQTTGPDYSPGGIYIDNTGSTVTVVNNVVAKNANRGVKGVNYTEIELINNTIVGNGASAIEMHAWPVTSAVPMTTTLINNIIADHPGCAFSGFNGAVFAVHHNDVVGHALDDCGAAIVAQSNNINADPLFVNPSQNDYHIRFGSPAMNAGTNDGAPANDQDNVPRPQGGRVDMGAYEVRIRQNYLPLTLKSMPAAPAFVGYWVNERLDTQGITRAEIHSQANTIFVHMWGACSPDDCDWGETTTSFADASDGVLSLTWLETYKVETQQLSVLPDSRLRIVGHTHFTDGSGRADIDYTEYYVVQPITETPSGYSHHFPYIGNCGNRPYGSVCLRFSDDYIWLVYDSIQGWREDGYWQGKIIEVAIGYSRDYYHIFGTDLVKYVTH